MQRYACSYCFACIVNIQSPEKCIHRNKKHLYNHCIQCTKTNKYTAKYLYILGNDSNERASLLPFPGIGTPQLKILTGNSPGLGKLIGSGKKQEKQRAAITAQSEKTDSPGSRRYAWYILSVSGRPEGPQAGHPEICKGYPGK